MVKNPIIITIIETSSGSRGGSSSSNPPKEPCLPCPAFQCPHGKRLESDGTDKCGCVINPRCAGGDANTR